MPQHLYKLTYTYQDYLSWNTEDRYELVDGIAYMMAAPSIKHQRILMDLGTQMSIWFKHKPCKVFSAPIDVRLFPQADGSDDTIVQPDLAVICDKSKLSDGKACRGAPDLVVEILSPSSKTLDLYTKKEQYFKAGVTEYWIVDGDTRQVQVNHLVQGEYRSFQAESMFHSPRFKGLTIDLVDVWNNLDF